MDIGFTVLALLMAFTGFFMLVGGFGMLVYLLWQQGREGQARHGGRPGMRARVLNCAQLPGDKQR